MAASCRGKIPCMGRRLKQPQNLGAQLRMLPESEMPRELVAPLERDVVDMTRAALEKMGYLTWSGRAAIYDPTPEGRQVRLERGWPLFLPILGPGTPDVLGIMPERQGRLFGLEFKRDLGEKERASQTKWREMASYWGIICATVRSVDEAVTYLEAHRLRP